MERRGDLGYTGHAVRPSVTHRHAERAARPIRVVVAVLGDLGRSPRMLYHAQALADSGADVELVGYAESDIDRAVALHPRIRIHRLRAAAHVPRALFAFRGLLRVARQSAELLSTLLVRVRQPDVLLVQNPPSVPTLLVALLVARTRSARLVIDWHNFGYAMLALRLGPRHVVVRLARRYERALGARADAHLCVSRAMAAELEARWGIDRPAVLYDRPAARFAPTPPALRREILARLQRDLRLPDPSRPIALVVSPSSWTPDEDFSLLIEAAARCDETMARDAASYPELVIVATGRGPLREQYARDMEALALRRVHLRTLWLSPEDYPAFVGAADLGLCLHRSASGLDLPMKVADLLGAGVPVCALDYGPCLAEVLRHGENGLLFSTAAELGGHLEALFRGYPDGAPELARLRANVSGLAGERWEDAWTAAALPLLMERPCGPRPPVDEPA
jgi:beta-1,4-mannosyltransferase